MVRTRKIRNFFYARAVFSSCTCHNANHRINDASSFDFLHLTSFLDLAMNDNSLSNDDNNLIDINYLLNSLILLLGVPVDTSCISNDANSFDWDKYL